MKKEHRKKMRKNSFETKADGKAWLLNDLRMVEMHKEEDEEKVEEKELGKEGKAEARAE
jgi:hypothetical protein